MNSHTILRRVLLQAIPLAFMAPALCRAAESTSERLKKVIVTHLRVKPERVTPKASFKEMGADDLDVTELMMAAEEEFNITIPEEAGKKFKTVGDFTKFVENAQKVQPAAKMAPSTPAPK